MDRHWDGALPLATSALVALLTAVFREQVISAAARSEQPFLLGLRMTDGRKCNVRRMNAAAFAVRTLSAISLAGAHLEAGCGACAALQRSGCDVRVA